MLHISRNRAYQPQQPTGEAMFINMIRSNHALQSAPLPNVASTTVDNVVASTYISGETPLTSDT